MMDQALLWLKFLAASSLVVAAGLSLTRNAERMAAAFGWGHAFAGFVILGCATSLPELTISLSSVLSVGSPTLATGNITGSIIFNLGILAALDLMARRGPVRDLAHLPGLVPLGLFNLVLLSGLLVMAADPASLAGAAAWVPAGFLLLGYAAASLHGWWSERASAADGGTSARPHPDDLLPQTDDALTQLADASPGEPAAPAGTAATLLRCVLAALVILGAGVALSHLGEQIASTYQLEAGFVGRVFLAVTSSLPELVTGVAAVRLGLHVMAAGSILGSNIFNLGILAACDLVYQRTCPAGSHLLLAAHGLEPFAAPRGLAAALAMTALLLLARRRQARAPGGRPEAGWAWAALALYVVAVLGS